MSIHQGWHTCTYKLGGDVECNPDWEDNCRRGQGQRSALPKLLWLGVNSGGYKINALSTFPIVMTEAV